MLKWRVAKRTKKTHPFADIGGRLRQARAALDIKNQVEFADGAGLNQPRYNQYETGAREITKDAARKLHAAYRITADWIFFADPSGLPPDMRLKILSKAS